MEENKEQPDNKNNSGADTSYVAGEIYLYLVKKYETKIDYDSEEYDYEDEEDYEDNEPEDEICGYECLGCGTTWDEEDCSEGDPCPACGAIALSPIYF